MRVICSLPLTAPQRASLPESFQQLGNEAGLSAEFGRRFPFLHRRSDDLLRAHLALVLMSLRRRFDAVVTGRYGEFFAVLQGLTPFGRRPHLLLDVEWLEVRRSWWRTRLNRWLHRRIVEGATRIQVFCHAEARNYARHYGVDESKFVWIPYCCDSAEPAQLEPGDFLLSSGLHQRDYATLLTAVADLPVEVRIAAPESEFRSLRIPPNVTVLGLVSAERYQRLLAGCRFVVLSLEPALLRFPGVMTYVQAMHMGKCVVVNDPLGAPTYLEHGETGLVVDPREPMLLRRQICALLASPEMALRIGMNARRAAAQRFSSGQYFSAVERAVQEAIAAESRPHPK